MGCRYCYVHGIPIQAGARRDAEVPTLGDGIASEEADEGDNDGKDGYHTEKPIDAELPPTGWRDATVEQRKRAFD